MFFSHYLNRQAGEQRKDWMNVAPLRVTWKKFSASLCV
jgi:hypothetical protein